MPGLPEITIVGTLTADPELRFTATGRAVAGFTVAANERRYNRESGRWEDAGALFLRCSVWGQQAENVAESLGRGARVIVRGTLEQRQFETRDGEKRTVMEVRVEEVAASLRFATVTVAKAARSGGSGGERDSDPWGAPPPAASSGGDRFTDEPPF